MERVARYAVERGLDVPGTGGVRGGEAGRQPVEGASGGVGGDGGGGDTEEGAIIVDREARVPGKQGVPGHEDVPEVYPGTGERMEDFLRWEPWWHTMATILHIMQLVMELLRRMDRGGQYMSLMIEWTQDLVRRVTDACAPLGRVFADRIIRRVQARTQHMLQLAHCAGFLQNPRRRHVEYFSGEVRDYPRWLVRQAKRYILTHTGFEEDGMDYIIACRQFEDFHMQQGTFGDWGGGEGRARGRACSGDRETIECASWWSQYGSGAPELQRCALRVMHMWSCASPAERNWAVHEGIHTKKRNQLAFEKVVQLVKITANVRLSEYRRAGCGYVLPWQRDEGMLDCQAGLELEPVRTGTRRGMTPEEIARQVALISRDPIGVFAPPAAEAVFVHGMSPPVITDLGSETVVAPPRLPSHFAPQEVHRPLDADELAREAVRDVTRLDRRIFDQRLQHPAWQAIPPLPWGPASPVWSGSTSTRARTAGDVPGVSGGIVETAPRTRDMPPPPPRPPVGDPSSSPTGRGSRSLHTPGRSRIRDTTADVGDMSDTALFRRTDIDLDSTRRVTEHTARLQPGLEPRDDRMTAVREVAASGCEPQQGRGRGVSADSLEHALRAATRATVAEASARVVVLRKAGAPVTIEEDDPETYVAVREEDEDYEGEEEGEEESERGSDECSAFFWKSRLEPFVMQSLVVNAMIPITEDNINIMSWWKLNEDKLDKVYEFMASELEARQEVIQEKEKQVKEEEERRKAREAEEKASRKLKERQEFDDRISTMVGMKINNACDLFLGRSEGARIGGIGEGARTFSNRAVRPSLDVDKERLEKQIELLRREYELIKKQMEELTRSSRNAIKERFEKAVARLVRQGRTPRSNLSKRLNKATDDDDLENLGQPEEGLDDLTVRPSPPKRTSGRLAVKAALAERAEFVKEMRKYLKRLKKNGLQMLCNKEGITFVTCEQAINEISELRVSLVFDFRQPPKTGAAARAHHESDVEEAREADNETSDVDATQHVDVADDEEQLGDE
ncbi:hypothetical protein CBR_g4798 [Chara braunii]|uniref:HAT C-terminal dimerisation domain-containing protein n=1 Tax=Chara braunii TaxID=69332 RepID=A0A388KIT9_CHABU|nr:hypothetical protein CBR_g4798 [Chara braunii]|eukprot:GBG69970.1 hypothetical protein CBR_g4798 [Chara braunii]